METDVRLLPVLPSLLIDLSELGPSSEQMVSAFQAVEVEPESLVLDLGCGKGAVAVALAERLGLRVEGIDAFPPFLRSARALAKERGVASRCRFRKGDIRRLLGKEGRYDAVLLLSVGPVSGDYEQTIAGIRTLVRKGGYIVIEDGFLADGIAQLPGADGYAGRSETLRGERHHVSGATTAWALMLTLFTSPAPAERWITAEPAELRQQCDRGQLYGCYRLGTLLAAGEGVAQDLPAALGLFQRVCRATGTRGCAALDCHSGRPARCGAYASDAASADHAALLHGRACEARVARSCFMVAQHQERVLHDYEGAGSYYQRACDMGEAEACFSLGVLYSTGSGRPTNRGRAAGLWERACDAGYARGCFNTTLEYASGRRQPRSAAYAATVFAKACDAGQGQGCWELGKVLAAGTGVPRDRERALEALTKACHDGGIRDACRDAERLRE